MSVMDSKVLEAILQTAVNSIITINNKGDVLSFNLSAEKMFGYASSDVIGQNVKMLMPDDIAKNHDSYLTQYTESKVKHIIGTGRELNALKKDGSTFPIWLSVSEVEMQDQNIFVGMIENISEKKSADQKLKYLSTHDTITNLLNYPAFSTKLEKLLNRNDRNVLLLIKINNFSEIQNSHGIWVSNLVLTELAKKLSSCLRSEDFVCRVTEGDIIAYLGNATFAILFSEKDLDPSTLDLVAQRIIQNLADSLVVNKQNIYPNVSVGISELYTGNSCDDIFKSADIALSLAIQNPDNNYCYFSPKYKEEFMRAVETAQEIHSAFEQNEFYLVYQPKINAKTNHIVGIEVLIRWESSIFGNVSPEEFITIAIREGVMLDIERRTLEIACAQFSRWKKLGYVSDTSLSVNVLPDQLSNTQYINTLKELLKTNDLEPNDLELEFLESDLMVEIKTILPALQSLNNLGIGLAIDDFGTGHSSLSRLELLPVNTLKIDRAFILGIGSPDSESIIKIILQLATLLKLDVVAEGVETKEQLDFLTSLGCDVIQGYYFSKPLKAKEMTQFLSSQQSSVDKK